MIQLFDIKTRTLDFAFCQPPKKSLPKSLIQKKSLQNFKPKKCPQITNFKPKKGLRTFPSLIYLSTPPPSPGVPSNHYLFHEGSYAATCSTFVCVVNLAQNFALSLFVIESLAVWVSQAHILAVKFGNNRDCEQNVAFYVFLQEWNIYGRGDHNAF